MVEDLRGVTGQLAEKVGRGVAALEIKGDIITFMTLDFITRIRELVSPLPLASLQRLRNLQPAAPPVWGERQDWEVPLILKVTTSPLSPLKSLSG